MNKLKNKTCVITGAARGIGRAIAELFLAEGGTVICTDINEALGKTTADELGCRFIKLDVRKEADWLALAAEVPDLHVLVNNAGVLGTEEKRPQDPEHISLDDWHNTLKVNLDGCFLGCQYAIRAMKTRGTGSIVNISSRSGLVGIPFASAYAASKAGIRNHSKTVALYCASQGWKIRCNSIHPAAINTPMWDVMLGHGPEREAKIKDLTKNSPLKRFGEPGEVAAVALLLASDDAPYITGSEYNVDGGLLAGSAAQPS